MLLVSGELPSEMACALSDGVGGESGPQEERLDSPQHDSKRIRLDNTDAQERDVPAVNSWSEACKSLRLRYFSPEELLHIFGFPETISYPSTVTNRKMYELIGNSLSVTVAGSLLKFLFARTRESN